VKNILFVINTLGQAGAETAMLELFRNMDPKEYKISLYVLMGQGEMISSVPEHVSVLNKTFDERPVLSQAGKGNMRKTVLKAMFRRGNIFRALPYLVKNFFSMVKRKKVLVEKLLWRILAMGADRFDEEYDLAVAYLEGGSAYYVADYVKAKKKASFIHVDYEKAGYTRSLDRNCYVGFDQVFTVSDEVKKSFLNAYPECQDKTEVFHNILNPETIIEKSTRDNGFEDSYDGMRLLTVGRLTTQKAFEVSIDAMKLLKNAGEKVRWYVLGEGDQRKKLEDKIEKLGLTEDFILLGATSNPYPYMRQADIYVHCSRFEGKSIAIQEAQILGKPMVVSDCSGNREQVIQGVDGILCDFNAEAICKSIKELLKDEEKRTAMGMMASKLWTAL